MRQVQRILMIACSAALAIAQTPSAQTKAQTALPSRQPGQPSQASTFPVAATIAAVAALGSCAAAIANFFMIQQLKRQDAFHKVADTLAHPDHVEARRKTRELQYQAEMTFAALIADEKKRKWLDQVCRDFDMLGMLDSAKRIDRTLVDRFYTVPFLKLYPFLKVYIDHLRSADGENRGSTHFWEIDRFYDRVKNVVHPSEMSPPRSDWPKNPRSRG